MPERPRVVYLCTGNAARSVMATVITRARTDAIEVRGAGTHSIEGLPMSQRTRSALAALGYSDGSHRSHQLLEADITEATVVVAFAPEHVEYVRRNHPLGAGRTVTLKRLVRDLPTGPATLGDRLAALDLATVSIETWEEIVDPAGHELPAFERCAVQINDLLDEALPRLINGSA